MQHVKRLIAAVTSIALLAAAPAPRHTPRPYIPPATPDAVTHHVNRVNGQTIRYSARAGTVTLRNDKDQITARMFYVAYTKDGADLNKRPITFFYNGGPGSSTIWLRMASYGPVRVQLTNGAATPPAPYNLVDNSDSILDKTDEVFVDAPNTGYSRLIGYGQPKDFMGVDQDGRAFTQFIQRYLSQFGRWNSPKFLFGESYGTTRDAVLVNMLQDANVQINGVVFQSSVLNFGLTGPGRVRSDRRRRLGICAVSPERSCDRVVSQPHSRTARQSSIVPERRGVVRRRRISARARARRYAGCGNTPRRRAQTSRLFRPLDAVHQQREHAYSVL